MQSSSITRVQQFIVGALMAGCFLFGGIVSVMVASGRIAPTGLSTGPFWLALVLLGGVAVGLPVMSQGGFEQRLAEFLRQGRSQEAGQAIVSRTVLRAALAEGFGIAGGSFAFVTASLPFAIAPFLAVAWLAMMFPTERKTQDLLRR
ncbi:MAG: hypothetical protein ISR76_08655 [Planctomycetes bacterium]|nr:hypothetical protein [Planctomycetota bacterium]MBL7009053.1 hypothetical protein [Planctomycetota bacterium]